MFQIYRYFITLDRRKMLREGFPQSSVSVLKGLICLLRFSDRRCSGVGDLIYHNFFLLFIYFTFLLFTNDFIQSSGFINCPCPSVPLLLHVGFLTLHDCTCCAINVRIINNPFYSPNMTDALLQQIRDLEEEVKSLKTQLRQETCPKAETEAAAESGPGGKNFCGQEGKRKGKKTSLAREFDFSVHPRRHVALRLAYLGWDYQGFAVQENTDNTVEARLFEALLKTRLIQDRQSSNYHRCGRTDKGVSAFTQVCLSTSASYLASLNFCI